MHANQLTVAEGIDQLVTLLPRLRPRAGMSLVASSTLATLERGGPMRITQLADAQGVTQPAMTGLVARLHTQGLVQRTSDPNDGRSVVVAATPSALGLLATRRHERAEALAALISQLDTDDQAALAAAVPAIIRLVSEGSPT